MEEVYQYVRNKKIVLLTGIVIVVLGGYFFLFHKVTPTSTLEPKQELTTQKDETKKSKTDSKAKEPQMIVVDVQGAVQKPGVYHVKDKAIIQEVIQTAGGFTANADLKQINQAKRVVDQMQVYIPIKGEKVTPTSTNSSNDTQNKKIVNINTATVDDFKDVTGIGPKKAEKVIAYREEHGQFKTLHDLINVSGIGEKSLAKLKDQLTV
ncbi:helix-hairpin-helix domain-containing protein [Companilactobacillus paralimentarius]|jgi:competence protein ComEA helix-hairpin-helix repeat region|nr:helix-hairpin-helix domain-containing protein [Companilactobacillus paralimentarius]MDR4933777.1 helix-hairpin-helix domain-containing protein [Companilactobacillus paralimentarius]